MAELLPCPFCGEKEHLYPAYRKRGAGEPYAIDCLGCGADYVPREGFDVIALWNRRTPPAPQQDRVTQLEAFVRKLASGEFVSDGWVQGEARALIEGGSDAA